MTLLTIATTQMPCTWDLQKNLDQAEQLVRDAAAQGGGYAGAHANLDQVQDRHREMTSTPLNN
jgi:predicted amidohydrolase